MTRSRTLGLGLAGLLVLTGCGTGSEDAAAPPVRAAEDVFVDAPVVEPGPDGTTAVLRVTTDVDMACAVVYGTTEELGDGIATDGDMGGGAHSDHEALMTGLEPGTEYSYRVQGSGADGQLYRSELMTFTTAEADPAAAGGPQVGVGAEVVAVSSEFDASFAAENAVDGDLATAWSTAGDGDDASITLDLGALTPLSGVALRSRSMGDGSAVISTFTVTLDDGEPLGPFDAGTAGPVAAVEGTAQVVRVDAETTTGGNTGAAEVVLLGVETG